MLAVSIHLPVLAIVFGLSATVNAHLHVAFAASYEDDLAVLRSEVRDIDDQMRLRIREMQNKELDFHRTVNNIRYCVLSDFRVQFFPLVTKVEQAREKFSEFFDRLMNYRDSLIDNKLQYDQDFEDDKFRIITGRSRSADQLLEDIVRNYIHYVKARYVDNMEFQVLRNVYNYELEIDSYMRLHQRYFSYCEINDPETIARLLSTETISNLDKIVDGILDRAESLSAIFKPMNIKEN
jgi:hypothetical protein